MSSKYYYLVAGLPELSLEDSKLSYTVADFKTEIYNGLSASDRRLIDLFYLKFDNANVLKLLKDKEAEIDKRGNYSAGELIEYISILREGGEISPKDFPAYLSTFIVDYLNTPAESTVLQEDYLAALYYEYAMRCGNKFVSAWFEFNLNINNILVAFTCRKFKWDIASNIVGNTEICEALRTSSARDFGLSGEVDVFESLVKISEITELVENTKSELKLFAGQAVNALKSEVATMVTDKLVTASVKDFAQDKDYLNAFIVALASKWSVDEPIVISTADAESLKKYFAAHAKALLDKGVTIQQVNGIKTYSLFLRRTVLIK